jgi:hypothetical protein
MCKTAECLYSIIPQIIIVSSHTRGKNSNLAKKQWKNPIQQTKYRHNVFDKK